MTQFLANIAGVLELVTVATGLVLMHRAGKEAPAGLLKVAGAVLIAGGILLGAATTTYWFRYWSHGDFAQAAPMTGPPPHGPMMGPDQAGREGAPRGRHQRPPRGGDRRGPEDAEQQPPEGPADEQGQ